MSRTSRGGRNEGGGHGGHAAASFTDLMASLMVIFVLLFVATVNNAAAKRQAVQADLLETLRAKLGATGFNPGSIRPDERDPYAIVIVMPDSLLFRLGRSDVEPGGQRYLRGMMPTLAEILCAPEMAPHIDNVVVEGHTDTTYIRGGSQAAYERGPEFNLALSQRRSMEVVRTSLASLDVRPSRACFRRMLSASGRGQEEPLAGVPGDDARQRRVVFKIRVQQDMAGELTGRVPPASAVIPTSSVEGGPRTAPVPGSPRAQSSPAADPTKVRDIRALYSAVEAEIRSGAWRGEKTQRDCEASTNGVWQSAVLYEDSTHVARKYELSGHSEHAVASAHYYYDAAGVLRFTFLRVAADDGTHAQRRVYFDAAGREVVRSGTLVSGPGSAFGEGFADAIRDPRAQFGSCE